ncbi:type IV secretory system conjugative DNA transfer family protein [Pseudodesulfovibrio piezophilus]|uniref:Type IV secretion system coupling protein TraD DNA-binding domain-containing protein n=1 Tax=Pseudodesulfovibrio piezophilus (strain DSM 21447 / JCM 15486 / C1TLV30) TaxID=1322246 RepID=M1WVJ7_PSEP2|nr:hypothetical protein [Pseudodesulfovibrio piezophilus]CCH48518.1 protein of unknown function [Pseudodesulfovibrio piezophilus C1TLV30]
MKTTQAFREKDLQNIQVFRGGISKEAKHVPMHPSLYQFDEGGTLSFNEGTHGVLVIGGVGRGKTASFMLPMASALIDAGLPGFIIDIKNNFTGQIRKLAKNAGREDDIVEIGTHPAATPVNLMAGLDVDEMQQMIESLLLSGQEHSKNIEWLHSGVRLLADIALLLRFVSQVDVRFAPSFVLMDRCVNDFRFVRNIFNMYLDRVYDNGDIKQRAFTNRVRTSPFHILSDKIYRTSLKYNEQLGFQLYGPRMVLGSITSDESLCNNLSGINCSTDLDYRKLLKENKIIILRFKHTQGHAAKLLARFIKEKFYADVYRTLDDCDQPEQCFFMADEFQDTINVSPDNTFDDLSWFSKAREFGCINIVATQALSSLYGNSLQHDQVNALVANCSTKIVLQNDDPAADKFFRHFCGLEKTLAQLGPSEALVARFDLDSRKQVVDTLHFTKIFKRIQDRLNSCGEVARVESDTPSLGSLMQELDEILFFETITTTMDGRKDYAELVTTFKNVLCSPSTLKLEYRPERHGDVMYALQSLNDRFGKGITVYGVAAIGNAGAYLDVGDDAEREDVADFLRELLEGKYHEG